MHPEVGGDFANRHLPARDAVLEEGAIAHELESLIAMHIDFIDRSFEVSEDDVRNLRSAFPAIEWDEPVPVHFVGETFYGCRICIALYGLSGRMMDKAVQDGVLHETWNDAAEHIRGH